MNIEKIANRVVRSLTASVWKDGEKESYRDEGWGSRWSGDNVQVRYRGEYYGDVERLLSPFKSKLKQFVPEGDYDEELFELIVDFEFLDVVMGERGDDWWDSEDQDYRLIEVAFVYWHANDQTEMGLKKGKLPSAFQEAVFKHFMDEMYDEYPGFRG